MTRRRKWAISAAIFVSAVIYLQWALWFSGNSITTLSQTRTQLNHEKANVEQLRLRNSNLAAEVIDIKTGEETMEERARMELGLIKEGETFYKFVDTELDSAESN